MAGITDLRASAEAIRRRGRFGDDLLVHMNREEFNGIAAMMPIKHTIHPETGLPEMFSWKSLLPIIGAVAGTFIGGPVGGAIGGAAGGAIAGGVGEGGSSQGALTGAALGGLGGYFGGGALEGAFPATFAGTLGTAGGAASLGGTGALGGYGALNLGGTGAALPLGAAGSGTAGVGTTALTGVEAASLGATGASAGAAGGGLGSLLSNPAAMMSVLALGGASGAGSGGAAPPPSQAGPPPIIPQEAPERPQIIPPAEFSSGFDPEFTYFDGQQFQDGGIVNNAIPQEALAPSGAIDPSAYGPLVNVPQANVSGPINAPVYQGQPGSQQDGNVWPFTSREITPPIEALSETEESSVGSPVASFAAPPEPPRWYETPWGYPNEREVAGRQGGIVSAKKYAEGGFVGNEQPSFPQPSTPGTNNDAARLQEQTKMAILGQVPNGQEIIKLFIETFGQEAFDLLQQQMMLEQQQNGANTPQAGIAPMPSPPVGDPQRAAGRLTTGQGGGLDDAIPASIDGTQPARLSDGEYVVPADVVSGLGDGSTAEGERRLSDMVGSIRKQRTGSVNQPGKIRPDLIQ